MSILPYYLAWLKLLTPWPHVPVLCATHVRDTARQGEPGSCRAELGMYMCRSEGPSRKTTGNKHVSIFLVTNRSGIRGARGEGRICFRNTAGQWWERSLLCVSSGAPEARSAPVGESVVEPAGQRVQTQRNIGARSRAPCNSEQGYRGVSHVLRAV